MSAIDKAYNFAKKSHGDQKRKSGEPYIIHPIHTALILADLELDKESIMAGLLHDVMEDTKVTREQMIELTACLKEEFDYVIIDCPAGIEQGFKNAIAGADRALVVTTPEVSAIRDADRIIGLLEANDIRDIQLIINRLRPDMIARGDMMSVEDVTEILAVDLIGTILDDEQIVIATNQGEPLSGKSSQAEEEYRNICQRIIGENVPFMNIAERKSFFRKIGNMFRK